MLGESPRQTRHYGHRIGSRGAETKLNSRSGYILTTILSGYIGINNPSIEYTGFYLRNTEIFCLGRIQFLPECNAKCASPTTAVMVGGRRNEAKVILQLSSTELFSNRRQQLERTIRRRSALGVENFPRRKVDFAKDIANSLTTRV